MSNPLRRDGPTMMSTGRDARPGETVTILVKDDKGKEIAEPIVFIRTNRAYPYDLADAYNARRRSPQSPYWYVDHSGNIKPGEAPARPVDPWKPEPGEIEATNAVVARAIATGMTQERFNELVANGTITREVRKTMQADVH